MNINTKLIDKHCIDKESQTLLFMGIFIFFMSVGEGMTAPAIPLHGDNIGASYKQLGFLMTGYSVTYTIMAITSGRISDIIGRKKILLLSITLSIIASTGYYFSSSPSTLLAFRTLEGMSRGILWPAAEAIVADNSNINTSGKIMGHFTAAYGAGVTIGTISGGYIMQYIGLTAVFPFYPILGVIVLVISLLGLHEKPINKIQKETNLNISKTNTAIYELKKIWPICFISFVYSGFLYSLWGLLSKIADFYGSSLVGIGIIFALFWFFRLITFILNDKIANLIGYKKILLIGITACTISTGAFIAANNLIYIITATIIGGIGTGIVFPSCLTLIANKVSHDYYGFSMGFMEFCMGIGMMIQTALSGIIGEFGGIKFTYFFTFILTIVSIFITIIFIHDIRQKTDMQIDISN
jgi:MFS family permease